MKDAAERRVALAEAQLVGPILDKAMDRLPELIESGKNEAAVGSAIRDVLDRVGVGRNAEAGDTEVRELLIRVRERITSKGGLA